MPLIFVGLSAPSLGTLIMLIKSKNRALWVDFFQRLRFNRIKKKFIPIVLLLFPSIILLAIALSLFFGQSINQFLVTASDPLLQERSSLFAGLLGKAGWL